MRLIDAVQTKAALPYPALVAALAERLRDGAEVPARHVHDWPATDAPDAARVTSLIMPAWTRPSPSGGHGYYGVKVINVAPGNVARGLPGLHGSYLLHDAATGVPLALIDGDVLTARRTVAMAALAARQLCDERPQRLLVVGAGRLAAELPAAYAAVLPLDSVTIWARRPEAAAPRVEAWRAEGLDASVAPSLEAAVRDADIVACVTLATQPVVQGAWLGPRSHLALLGSFTPAMREADDDALRGATLVVDSEDALAKSGDLIGPLSRGVLGEPPCWRTLAQCLGPQKLRGAGPAAAGRSVYKSVGHALQDLAAAALVARSAGL